MKSAYFFENWADYVKLLDEKKRLTFFDTFIKVCFDGAIPSAADGDAFMFYCLIRPAVEERDLRVKLSKSGVEARQVKRRKSSVDTAVTTAVDTAVTTAVDTAVTTAVDTAVDTYKRGEEKRRDEKENESESVARSRKHSRTRSRSTSSIQTSDDVPAVRSPSDDLPNARPSAEDIRVAAHNLGVPDWFRDYYASEMEKVGWTERNSRKPGSTIPVTRSNVVHSMRGWWECEKKSSAARVAAEAASAAEATPMTGAGRCAVPIATTEIV